MIKAGNIVDKVLRDMNRESNTEDEAYVWQVLNLKYIEICAQHSFLLLRKSPITIDLEDASYSSGMILPADMLGIDRVRTEDDIEVIPKDGGEVDPDEANYRYYTYAFQDSALYTSSVTDIALATSSGVKTSTLKVLSTQFTGSVADLEGEYFTVDGKFGVYKITDSAASSPNTLTFLPNWRYTTASTGTIRIRPEFTRKIVCIDPEGDEITDKEITVWYWAYPPPLNNDDDPVLLPTADPLILKVLREMPEAKGRRAVSQQEAEEAMRTCINLNPSFAREDRVRDKHNQLFRFRSNIFAERD